MPSTQSEFSAETHYPQRPVPDAPVLHSEVRALLADLPEQMRAVLGHKLVGLYLYGSVVTGDFDLGVSDVDLLAVIASPLDAGEFDALDVMHQGLVRRHPQWDDRIEILYYTAEGLQTFRRARSPIAVISPGEPFNVKDAGMDWLMNWYLTREMGWTLYGPPPASLIEPISTAEFVAAVRDHALSWRTWIESTRDDCKYQSYATLTLCRTLYTVTHGAHVSKVQAARWVAGQWPQWETLIRRAVAWRVAEQVDADPAATFPETERFVRFVGAQFT